MIDQNLLIVIMTTGAGLIGGGLTWLGKYIFDFWKAKHEMLDGKEANVNAILTKQLQDMQTKMSNMEITMDAMRAKEVEYVSKAAAMEVKIQFLTETVASQAKKIELLEKAERLDMPRESK